MAKRKRQRELFPEDFSFYESAGAYEEGPTNYGVKRKLFDEEDDIVPVDEWMTYGSYSEPKSRPSKSKARSISYGLFDSGKKEKPKTSVTHPLRVDTFPPDALPLPGQLGMTISPGKQQRSGWGGHHDRDLKLDLERLRDHYKTNTVVTLIEGDEFKELKTPSLVQDVTAHGMRAVWFPIPDMHAPKNVVPAMELVEDLYDDLEKGKNVVIHCKGGLGRTGLLAACLLIRVGHTANNAIAWTRYVRKGTIQTQEQEVFVYQYAFEIGGSK